MSVINIENVTKTFGKFTALDGISMEVQKGEIYGFIGPNGAGKTTTIRILLGIYRATQGRTQIFGLNAWKDAVKIHKKIAYVPGDVNLWGNLSGGEVIDFFLRLGKNYNSKKKNELIERFDLDPTKKCRNYSKGNRQKVALIAAFASEAELYIFDEPTSGLDPLMENVFQECVKEERYRGKSILLSSHILSEVEKLCDKVSIIRKGKIIESGSLKSLRHLTKTNIRIDSDLDLNTAKEMNNIYNARRDKDSLIFEVDTENIGKIISYLGKFNIKNLEVTPVTLEDLFNHYYEGK